MTFCEAHSHFNPVHPLVVPPVLLIKYMWYYNSVWYRLVLGSCISPVAFEESMHLFLLRWLILLSFALIRNRHTTSSFSSIGSVFCTFLCHTHHLHVLFHGIHNSFFFFSFSCQVSPFPLSSFSYMPFSVMFEPCQSLLSLLRCLQTDGRICNVYIMYSFFVLSPLVTRRAHRRIFASCLFVIDTNVIPNNMAAITTILYAFPLILVEMFLLHVTPVTLLQPTLSS